MTSADEHLTDIPLTECVELLRAETVGRIGVVVEGRPEIFPVNYALDAGDSILLRSAVGTKLAAAVNHHVVFEVDRIDAAGGRGWSVVVHGVAHQTDRVREGTAPLASWAPGATHLIRIAGSSISGRRIHR